MLYAQPEVAGHATKIQGGDVIVSVTGFIGRVTCLVRKGDVLVVVISDDRRKQRLRFNLRDGITSASRLSSIRPRDRALARRPLRFRGLRSKNFDAHLARS